MINWLSVLLRRQLHLDRLAERLSLENDKEQIAKELEDVLVRVHTLEWQADIKQRTRLL